jgi:hypothetical protein
VGYIQQRNTLAALNIMGGMVSNSSSFSVGQPISFLPGTGVVNITSGSLYLGAMYLGAASNAVGILQQSGGIVRPTSSLYVGNAAAAQGLVDVSGGSLVMSGVL